MVNGEVSPIVWGCVAAVLLSLALQGAAGAGLLPVWMAVLGCLVVAGGLVGATVLASARIDLRWFGPAVCRGPSDKPVVALTFDDGPHPASTHLLLDALRDAGAKATFFVLVDAAEKHPELLRAIAAEHEIGLHGLAHHARLTYLPPRTGAAELQEGVRRLRDIVGIEVQWYRPPFGVTSPRLARAVQLAGLRTAWCSIRTRDGVAMAPEVLRSKCAAAGPGDVVLLHEGERSAKEVLAQVLHDLDARGLQARTFQEVVS